MTEVETVFRIVVFAALLLVQLPWMLRCAGWIGDLLVAVQPVVQRRRPRFHTWRQKRHA